MFYSLELSLYILLLKLSLTANKASPWILLCIIIASEKKDGAQSFPYNDRWDGAKYFPYWRVYISVGVHCISTYVSNSYPFATTKKKEAKMSLANNIWKEAIILLRLFLLHEEKES